MYAIRSYYDECLAEIALLPESGDAGKGSVFAKKDTAKLAGLEERFQKVMDNDFNTAQAIAGLFDTVKILNKIIRALPAEPGQNDLDVLRNAGSKIKELAGIMGLLVEDPVEHTRTMQKKLLEKLDMDTEAIERLIRERSLRNNFV